MISFLHNFQWSMYNKKIHLSYLGRAIPEWGPPFSFRFPRLLPPPSGEVTGESGAVCTGFNIFLRVPLSTWQLSFLSGWCNWSVLLLRARRLAPIKIQNIFRTHLRWMLDRTFLLYQTLSVCPKEYDSRQAKCLFIYLFIFRELRRIIWIILTWSQIWKPHSAWRK